jgi:hypothetical protein
MMSALRSAPRILQLGKQLCRRSSPGIWRPIPRPPKPHAAKAWAGANPPAPLFSTPQNWRMVHARSDAGTRIQNLERVRGRQPDDLAAPLNLRGLARPAGLEPATSRFEVWSFYFPQMSAFFLWAPFSDNLHFACFQYVLVVSSFRRCLVFDGARWPPESPLTGRQKSSSAPIATIDPKIAPFSS